jgi:hypothetical protein
VICQPTVSLSIGRKVYEPRYRSRLVGWLDPGFSPSYEIEVVEALFPERASRAIPTEESE